MKVKGGKVQVEHMYSGPSKLLTVKRGRENLSFLGPMIINQR